jgi:DNA-binding MarR family transcriptional regulator/GNAT superfamily N-acetyltransferase
MLMEDPMPADVIEGLSDLFLGSRLKRLAERMQSEVVRVVERAGMNLLPSHYPILISIDQQGPGTIGELTTTLKLTQPSVTRSVSRLIEMGLVEMNRTHRDQRRKTISLTTAGKLALDRSTLLVFPQIEAGVREVLEGLGGSFLNQVGQIEARLDERPLDQRGLSPRSNGLQVREFNDDLAGDFREINIEWITNMYSVEPADLEVLDDPKTSIIERGGIILFVESPGLGIVGTCALQKTGEQEYELCKMAVRESARGQKAGEFLLRAAIDRALEVTIPRQSRGPSYCEPLKAALGALTRPRLIAT